MNPELPSNPREELELRVTSLLLGELSGAEAASVRAFIANDPELQKLHDDLKQTIHLVREATVNAGETAHEESTPLKLSEERRQSLMTAFIIPPLKPEHIKVKRERQWFVPVAAVAMILVVACMWLFIAPRREREALLALNEERESLARPTVRRVTPLSGKRPEDGRESGDRVQVSGQVATTTVSGRAAKTAEQNYQTFEVVESSDAPKIVGAAPSPKSATKPPAGLKFRTWGASSSTRGFYDDDYSKSPQTEPSVVTTLPAELRLALPPTEIVLPKAGEVPSGDLADSQNVSSFDMNYSTGNFGGGGGGGGRGGGGGGGGAGGAVFGKGEVAPPDVSVRAKFSGVEQKDKKAVGFDWYLGNLATSSGGASGGKAGDNTPPEHAGEPALSGSSAFVASDESGHGSSFAGAASQPTDRKTIDESVEVLRRRVDQLGVANGDINGPRNLGEEFEGRPANPELNKSGNGTLSISGANNFTGGTVVGGGTIVNSGSVTIAGSDRDGDALTANGGTALTTGTLEESRKANGFNLNRISPPNAKESGFNLNVVRLAIEAPVAESDLYGPDAKAPSFSGSPAASQPASALNKSSTGTLTVSGENSFNGGTVVNGGTLAMAEKPAPVLGDVPLIGRLYRSEGNARPATELVTIDGKKYEKEFVGYDDPGQFIPQAQSASGGSGGVGLPLTAQMPLPHYRLKPVVTAPESTGEATWGSFDGAVAEPHVFTNGIAVSDAEWVGVLEPASKTKGAGNQFVNRFAYAVAPTKSESVPRGKRESNIVLPSTDAPAIAPKQQVHVFEFANSDPAEAKQASEDLFAKEPGVAKPQFNEQQRQESSRSIKDGKALFEAGKYDEAEAKMKEVLKTEPDNHAAAYYFSLVKEQRDANAQLSRVPQSKERILQVENAWDTSAAREKLSVPNPYAQTNLKTSLKKQIVVTRNELARERDKLKISDSGYGGSEPAGTLDFSTVQMLNGRLIEEESSLKATEKRYEALKGLSREEQLKALPNVAPDAQFNELSQQLNLAQQALIKAQKDVSPDDPRYKNTKALVEDLTEKVNDRADGVMVGMKTWVDSTKAGVDSLRGKLEATKRNDIAHAAETRPYYDKKRELDNLVSFQKILEQRLAMEKVDVTLPRSGMVTVMNRATPPAKTEPGLLGRIFSGDYKATASVKIDRPSADTAEFTGKQSSGVYDPYFIQTEFEAIKSEAVLTNVVTALDLRNTWGTNRSGGQPLKTSEAVEMLRRRLELKPVRGTMIMELQGKSSDPTEAATIANAVAEAYQQHRLAEIKRASEGGVRALEERFVEQQAKVKKAAQELAALREGTKPGAPVTVIDAPLPRKPATNAPVAQPEVQTSENNFSTFSLNVSDVSFKLAAASLEKGQMPDSASIRSEEFINAFDYRDPEPKWDSASSLSDQAGKMPAPLAFAWERARYPFAHNRDLLRFSLKTAAAGRQAGRPLNVVLLLDNSGSMERADRVGIIREALRVLVAQLQPQDKLSVITFARTPRLVADGITGDKAGEVAERVSGLTPEGGTNLEDAMNLAYQTAAKHFLANGINRVVVLTDGAANLGDVQPESLKQKVETNRKQGIALDCFGIGWEGFNDDLLEVLSRNGDGRYGFINSPEEAASEFAGQLAGALKVAASDVKVQVEFNPKRVTSYRQIGYAKHQLTKEQFRDNTVDAAEIAAQEAGNALYTVEVNPAGEGPLATVHVRYKIPGTTDYREQAWDVPFKGGAVSLEQSSPAMRLATSASAFSEWLAVNPFAGEVTPDALLNTLSGVPEVFGADPRPKKLEWMIRQAKSLEGK